MKKNRIKVVLATVGVVLAFYSCQKELRSQEEEVDQLKTFRVADAKAYFEKNVGSIQPLQFTTGSGATKGGGSQQPLSAQWEHAQQFNNPGQILSTHAIPLSGNYARRALLRHQGRDEPGTHVSVQSNLIIRHNELTGATVSFVETVLRYAGPEKAPRNWNRYQPTPAEQFTLFIFSTIDGEYLQAIKRVNLRNSQVNIRPEAGKASRARTTSETEYLPILAYFSADSIGGGEDGGDGGLSYCPFCHQVVQSDVCTFCDPIVVTAPPICPLCRAEKINGRCNCCPHCGRRDCNGNCSSGGDGGSGGTGGGSPGDSESDNPSPSLDYGTLDSLGFEWQRCDICHQYVCDKPHPRCSTQAITAKNNTNAGYSNLSTVEALDVGTRHYPTFREYIDQAHGSNIEYAADLKYYQDENLYRIYEILPGTTNSAPTYAGTSGSHYVATIHSHPDPSIPSGRDVITTASCAKSNPDFKYMYIYAQGETYAFHVADRVKAEAFYNAYRSQVDANNRFTEDLKETSEDVDKLTTFNKFSKKTKELYALARVLQKHDAGIDLLYKASPSSSFETLYIYIDQDDSRLASAVYCP